MRALYRRNIKKLLRESEISTINRDNYFLRFIAVFCGFFDQPSSRHGKNMHFAAVSAKSVYKPRLFRFKVKRHDLAGITMHFEGFLSRFFTYILL